MSEKTQAAGGGCLCGAVRYKASGRRLWVAHCHCQSCRRNTGAPVATFVGYGQEQFAFVSGVPMSYNSSPGVTRSFCGQCGTPLTYESDFYPGEVHILLGTLDNPEDFVPQVHVHVGEKLPWLEIHDGRPRYLATTRNAKPVP
jgi:hypothetical protein